MTVAIERRSVLLGLGALFAAPAIVKASSLMKVAPTEIWRPLPHQLLTIDQITREAVERFVNSNEAIKEMNRQYEADYKFVSGEQWPNEFAAESAKIGDVLRILYQIPKQPVPQIPDSLAVAAAAVAAMPVLLAKPVTRRFWSK